jgi:serine phosphatase RsbU (regulator of sigma subunit)
VGLVAFGFVSQKRYGKKLLAKGEKIKLQKQIIKASNENLLASIRYARTVQEAFLPEPVQLNSLFSEYYILNSPKDLVGGDFYWAKQTSQFKIICLGDCTGHGVPAAFLTITFINILNKIALQNLETPGEFLAEVQNEIFDTLKESQLQDGLDLSVCFFSLDDSSLSFSSAHQGLLIYRNGVLEDIKGDRRGLGKDFNHIKEPFTNHSFELKGEERFCIFSDGITDQSGGPNYKKIGKKTWLDSFKNTANETTKVQGKLLEEKFLDWKKENAQTDDATVLIFEV